VADRVNQALPSCIAEDWRRVYPSSADGNVDSFTPVIPCSLQAEADAHLSMADVELHFPLPYMQHNASSFAVVHMMMFQCLIPQYAYKTN
jgi:hypothetical protein